ncbi:MAG: ABC transporter ATP-binding protein [Alphaproteobacteria bacterium]|uniref:ABC transporter ATP-binding protein n=1 Tax=Candidatus Nitrobium versatile TaxID=2884831 RepID=A0A953LZ73_9BACT|nr:ABC transporter ATP-binding protein [Candidatus Nitrobium versatile]
MELKVTGINKSFRSTAGEEKVEILRDISFTVRKGKFVSIIGPSGCGKTTLLRIISGLEHPDRGTVLLGDRAIASPVRDIGYIFQESALLPWRTVRKNIEFGLEVAGVDRKERERRALASLELVELTGFGDFYPREISGGMKQKVALAMSLVVEPKVLLMDEPFVSLDCQTRSYLQQVLLHVWEKTGKTVIFITHNVEEAVFLGDEVICLTSRPTVIGKVVPVDIPRPRERTSPELNRVRKEILLFLEEERQRAGIRYRNGAG